MSRVAKVSVYPFIEEANSQCFYRISDFPSHYGVAVFIEAGRRLQTSLSLASAICEYGKMLFLAKIALFG